MPASDTPDRDSCRTEDGTLQFEEDSPPPWLPDEATIISEETFTSPKGRRYRILRTNLTDPDDRPATEEHQDP
jgi:hypothetical protein